MICTTGLLLLTAACSNEDRAARRRAAGPTPTREALARVASVAAGAALFNRCATCHPIRPQALDRNGPNLFGVMGKPVASNSARFAYTAALQRAGGTWTPARMDAWLADPQTFAPGTAMTIAGVPDPLDRADLIAFLQAQH